MIRLFANYPCTCGHIKKHHYQEQGIDPRNYYCRTCVNLIYREGKKDQNWKHDFKLDNLKYLESKLIEKENGR